MAEPAPRSYPALDALRGVAAILVALFHFRSDFTTYKFYPAGDGYLAVDLFFVLSGFVLAHAYRPRLARGLGVGRFMALRLIRLYPLYALGLAMGTAVMLAAPPEGYGPAAILQAALLEAAFIPVPHTLHNQIFPINTVGWSLFFELVVNLLFALAWRRLGLRGLLTILALGGLVLAGLVLVLHRAALGDTWRSAPAGLVRTVFSFALGLLLYHLHQRGWLRPRNGALAFHAGLALLAIWLLLPVPDALRGAYDLVFILLVSPGLVVLGISPALHGRSLAWFGFLGAASYALYAIHLPIVTLIELATADLPDLPVLPLGLVSVALLVGVAWLVDLAYDTPVRRRLSRLLPAPAPAPASPSPAPGSANGAR